MAHGSPIACRSMVPAGLLLLLIGPHAVLAWATQSAVEGMLKAVAPSSSIWSRLPRTLSTEDFEQLTAELRAQHCEATYGELYQPIFQDLGRWNETGITQQMMVGAMESHTCFTPLQKGFAAGFYRGKAILPTVPLLNTDIGHHAGLWFVYMQALIDLERLFGTLIPDVEFVISTIDRPIYMARNRARAMEPVLRFCKTNSHADILIPIFHFYMREHNSQLLDNIPKINAKYPWKVRKPKLFGRFSPYLRHMHPDDPYTQRKGFNGSRICTNDTVGVEACRVRTHFIAWSKQHRQLDVDRHPKVKMADHAAYKYLVHLDGQGLSSRIDQLLPLGSLVFKEESGYRSFYYHLLKEYEHYVPFWKEVPEEVLAGLEWARWNDDKARQIGQNAQDFAKRYLTRNARACYWFKLLKEYAVRLKYKPGPGQHKYSNYYKLASEYIATEALAWEGGRRFKNYPFSP